MGQCQKVIVMIYLDMPKPAIYTFYGSSHHCNSFLISGRQQWYTFILVYDAQTKHSKLSAATVKFIFPSAEMQFQCDSILSRHEK